VSLIVLDALDTSCGFLSERLAGMDDVEYLWSPAQDPWTVIQADDGSLQADWEDIDPVPAPVTTIAWRMWHIAVDALDSYSSRLFGHNGTGLEGRAWVASAAEAQVLLARSVANFRAGVAAWNDDQLFELLGPAWGPYADRTNLDLVLHAQREVIHHAAEIALLRDLYSAMVTRGS
jgi:DinB superfamily